MGSKATSLLLIFLMVFTGVTEVQNNPLQSITKVNTNEIISEYNLAMSDIINEDRYCGYKFEWNPNRSAGFKLETIRVITN